MLALAAGPRLFGHQPQSATGSAPASRVKASALDRRQFLGVMSHSAFASLDDGACGNGAAAGNEREAEARSRLLSFLLRPRPLEPSSTVGDALLNALLW